MFYFISFILARETFSFFFSCRFINDSRRTARRVSAHAVNDTHTHINALAVSMQRSWNYYTHAYGDNDGERSYRGRAASSLRREFCGFLNILIFEFQHSESDTRTLVFAGRSPDKPYIIPARSRTEERFCYYYKIFLFFYYYFHYYFFFSLRPIQ